MDRREMLKGAGGAFAAASLGMSGLSESVRGQHTQSIEPSPLAKGITIHGPKPTGFDFGTMDATVWAREFVARFGGDEELMRAWFANAIMAGYDEANRRRDKSYDPVAVLEAMRERKFDASYCLGYTPTGHVFATWWPTGTSLFDSLTRNVSFPDFRSAVLWLHRQAAAADAEFAQAWPVQEGE